MKHVLPLAGEIGAGKSAITNYLKARYGASSLRFSDPMRQTLGTLGLEVTRENLSALSTAVRGAFGENVFGAALAAQILKDPADVVIVDGARRSQDLAPLSHLPGYRLLYIEASVRTRYERITQRQENVGEDKKTFEEFMASQELETEIHIRNLREIAGEIIVNEKGLPELHTQLDALMAKLGVAKK